MTIQKNLNTRNIFARTILVGLLALGIGCAPDQTDAPIPPVVFPDIFISLNLPENIGLRTPGTSKALSTGGVRGIILRCETAGVYFAYERNCSFHPNDACATVNIDASSFFMIDPCCGSSFAFDTGMPTGGVAWRPLRKYNTTFNGSDVIITDDIVQEP